MTNSQKPPLVFLASLSYSGSTLLSFLLATHPEVASVGEMTGIIESEDPEEYRCSCGERIKECGFWRSVAADMSTGGFDFRVENFDTRFRLGTSPLTRRLRTGSLRNNHLEHIRDAVLRFWPGHTTQMSRIGARNQALAESILRVTGKSVFLDASKYHMRIKYLLRYTDCDIKVIHLIRDARGTVNSFMGYRKGISAETAAEKWVTGNKNIERQLRALTPDRHIRIRYEDLCRDVPATLERLHRFCGVAPGLFEKDFRRVPHHVVGNKMRLRDSSEIRLDERWKTSLDETQLGAIDQVSATMLRAYGYE